MLQSWDPFTVLAQLDEDFDDLVRRTWGSATSGRLALGYVPPVDMYVDGKDVVIRLDLPGIDVDKDVDIQIEDHRLTISGSRRHSTEESADGDRILVRELHQGSFWRQFALPEGVSASDIAASYDRGILSVRVKDVVKRHKGEKIAIKAANGASQISAHEGGRR